MSMKSVTYLTMMNYQTVKARRLIMTKTMKKHRKGVRTKMPKVKSTFSIYQQRSKMVNIFSSEWQCQKKYWRDDDVH